MTIKSILAGAAVAALVAGGAAAQTATDPAAPAPAVPGAAAPAEPGMPSVADPGAPATPPAADIADMPEGFSSIDLAAISTDQLIGANIVNHQDETIASVDDVLVSDSGQVESVVAKFGGFLGFGSDLVKLGLDQIDVMQDGDGTLLVRTALTPEEIEAMPEYDAPEN